jgi:hypothetical protein
MKDEERMQPITSNGAELVCLNPGQRMDLASEFVRIRVRSSAVV